VYLEGSTAIKGVISQIGISLSQATPPVTVVYNGNGSCNGVLAVSDAVSPNPTPLSGTGNFTYWTLVGGVVTANSCDLVATDNAFLNIGLSDVFETSCANVPNNIQGVTDYQGPVQAMTFIVPKGSSQSSISAEAAYFAFGFGNNSGVMPWNQAKYLYQRGPSSGTQSMIAFALGVKPTLWFGNFETSTGAMVTAISGNDVPLTAQQNGTLGIMAAEDVDAQLRATPPASIKELAYQHFSQNCGYLPDSAPGLFDKKNVRDGHYAIWGPVHALPIPVPSTNPNATILKASISTIVGLLTGTAQAGAGIDLIAFEAQNGIIPQCAMRVTRMQEVGPVSVVPPGMNSKPCGCYFEHIADQMAGTDTKCATCKTSADCPSGYTCPIWGNNMGWCEAP
jgi:hypothetical protein